MPTIHIPEATFRRLVERESGYDAAKRAVKDAAEARAKSEAPEGDE